MTELSLDVSQTRNKKVIRLFDTSQYDPIAVIDNYIVEVLPVNKTVWIPFYVNKNFSLTLNSSSLGYRKVNDSSELADLPDGIYEFKQSFKPNQATMAHYYHLRTVDVRLKYMQSLSSHFSDECKKDKRMFEIEIETLSSIRNYLEAAEYLASDCHDKKTAIKYYNKVVDLLKRYDNECGCRKG